MFDFSYETQAFFIDAASSSVGFAANWLLQSTILISIGLLVGWVLRSRGSAVQSLVYRTTLLAIFACPLATLALSASGFTGWSIDMPTAWERSEVFNTSDGIEAAASAVALPEVDSQLTAESPALDSFSDESVSAPFPVVALGSGAEVPVAEPMDIEDVQSADVPPVASPEPVQMSAEAGNRISLQTFGFIAIVATLIWMAIGLFFIVRLCSAWLSLCRLTRNSTPVDDQLLNQCDRLAKQIEVATPRVLRSPFLPSPCLAGIRRPTILMPATDSELSIQDLLVHELAHLLRKDCHWNLLRQIATAVMFFQPLIWVLSRRIEVTAEEVCDDFVVQFGGDRADYANRLVDIAELATARIAPAGVGVVSLRSMLSSRVSRILDTSRVISTKASRALLLSVLGCGVLGTAMTGLLGLRSETSVVHPAPTELVINEDANEEGVKSQFKGQVVGPDGKPVSDAKIYMVFYKPEPFGLYEPNAEPVALTDSNGNFDFTIDKSEPNYRHFDGGRIAAAKTGFGLTWCPSFVFNVDSKTRNKFRDQLDEFTGDFRTYMQNTLARAGKPLQLVRDNDPVKGKLLNIEGQPVVGATLTLLKVSTGENDSLDEWNAAAIEPNADFYSAREKTQRSIVSSQVRSLIAPTVANANGEFRINGIGNGRIIELLVQGPSIATEKILVRTESGKAVKLSQSQGMGMASKNLDTYHPNQFTLIAAPSADIFGVVRNAETNEPVAGAIIKSQKRHGEGVSGWGQDFVRTVTDDQGRYRLTGMPIGSDNKIAFIPPEGDVAYLPVNRKAPLASPSEPMELDIDLKVGVWLEGVVTDKQSGNGVKGQVGYCVLADSPNYRSALSMGVDQREERRIGADGKFRFAVLAGPAVVTFQAHSKETKYPRCKHITQQDGTFKETEKNGYVKAAPQFLMPINYNAVMEIDAPQEGVATIEIELDAGEELVGSVIDSNGRDVTEFSYTGHQDSMKGSWEYSKKGKFVLVRYDEDSEREVYLTSNDRKHAGYVKLTGKQESDFAVKLKPAGSVKGRLLDDDGQPIANCQLRRWRPRFTEPKAESDSSQTDSPPLPLNLSHSRAPNHVTDSKGRFEIEGLVAGVEYRILAFRSKDRETVVGIYRLLRQTIKVGPSESKDLGDVKLVSEQEMESMRTGAESPADRTDVSRNGRESATIQTNIQLPDGNAAANTHVSLVGYSQRAEKDVTFGSGVTNDSGSCTLTCEGRIGSDENPKYLVARKDGLAIGWKMLNPAMLAEDKPVTVKLHEVGIIKGRLVDIEGQPAAGEKLRVEMVFNTQAERGSNDSMVRFSMAKDGQAESAPQAWIQPTTTDDEGRFELTGIPKKFGVYVTLYDSKNFAPQGISLNTGQPEQRGPRDGTYRPLVKNVEPGEEAVLTISPAKIITGTVTYEDTDEPVRNAKISIWASQEEFGSMSSITGKTDSDGRYRMLPKPGIRFGVSAYPPSGTAYMGRQAETLAWENGDAKRNVDIKLPRVTLVKGRVIEKGTGKPVADATITFEGSDRNAPRNAITGWQAQQKTDDDGKFSYAVPAGLGTLVVRKKNSGYVLQTMDSRKMKSKKPGGSRFYANAFHTMNVEKGTDTIEAEIEVLPGKTVRGVVVDEGGKSVEEVCIVTRLKSWDLSGGWRGDSRPTLGGKFELKGLLPGETYKVHFLDAKQKLGTTVELKSTDTNVEVVLQPCGSAKAKFNVEDDDKRALLNQMGSPPLSFMLMPGVSKYDFKSRKLGLLAADEDFNANIDRVNYRSFDGGGPQLDDEFNVTYPALIPGATYRLQTTFDQSFGYKEFVAKAGETLDLGEFTPTFED